MEKRASSLASRDWLQRSIALSYVVGGHAVKWTETCSHREEQAERQTLLSREPSKRWPLLTEFSPHQQQWVEGSFWLLKVMVPKETMCLEDTREDPLHRSFSWRRQFSKLAIVWSQSLPREHTGYFPRMGSNQLPVTPVMLSQGHLY